MLKRLRISGRVMAGERMCLAAILIASILAAPLCGPALASIHRHHWQPVVHHWLPTAASFGLTDPEKDAALVVDGETGKALYARNADALRHPASLTKMMTLYLLFDQLKSGQMTLASPLSVSEHAAVQARTKLYLRPGTSIPVDAAIKAIVVLSANDVAVVIAEAIGGTEQHFAEMMTAKARSLGMTHTFYHNASGLPDPLQITTAGDLAVLARHLAYDFPQYFHYFSTYSFSYRNGTYFTHDNLIGRYAGADGIKTGYTGASGFNLVSSVVRNGAHVIGVVMGGVSARRRDSEMVRLLDDTFASIAQNPQLVARANVPWQALADSTQTKPIIAGFQLGDSGAVTPRSNLFEAAAPLPRSGPGQTADDEDAAESRPDTAYEPAQTVAPAARPVSRPPAPQTVTARPTPEAPHLADHSADGPAVIPAAPFLEAPSAGVPLPRRRPEVELAAYEPKLPGSMSPEPRDVALENHRAPAATNPAGQTLPSADGGGDWTIQIGAYGDAATAKAELGAYAQRSMDVLGEAARIVAPIQSVEGHTLYRARFGPFVEREARDVCQRLTERGQTCFAAVAAR